MWHVKKWYLCMNESHLEIIQIVFTNEAERNILLYLAISVVDGENYF